MYFLLKMGIFHPVMLVNSGVYLYHTTWTWWNKHPIQADGIPEKLVAHKTFPGDRPSLPWKLRELDEEKCWAMKKKGPLVFV